MKIPSILNKPQIVPTGVLQRLKPEDVYPSPNNPRQLFDPEPLAVLKENIRDHGVLVPITVYKLKGETKFSILDGERRHRCCVELKEEGHEVFIPANIVDAPDRLAGLLYMFNIHNFRQGWELMPVALSLKAIMADLKQEDTRKLHDLTGLSEPQIERCKLLLTYKRRFQELSLDPDPTTRIPANFWIELFPLFDITEKVLPKLYEKMEKDGLCETMVLKYRAKSIKSVIHFRRIVDAYEVTIDTDARGFATALKTYIEDTDAETRAVFDHFVAEPKKIGTALAACDDFLKQIRKSKVEHIIDRDEVMKRLTDVKKYIEQLLTKLEGTDAPKE